MFQDLETLFEQWTAPDSLPNIQVENIDEDPQAPHDLSILTSDINVIFPDNARQLSWKFLDENNKAFFVHTSGFPDYAIIYSPEFKMTKIAIGLSGTKKCYDVEYIFGEEGESGMPLDKLFIPFPEQKDGLKYEPIFPHGEFSRLTSKRQSLGNEL